ncbi:MAG: hypothetical protein A2010_04390 [Nitrospirae bacterium GWD2_57_9]|nr:MAG: hypothetical protein A2010_04390 [Nitrospirae bacterium GWD2_57_9]OGW46563.1 MAG: hypothetical protein A2078_06530 [Nitrospirae bacterium GWC2_57_9]
MRINRPLNRSALNRTLGRYLAPAGLVLALIALTMEMLAGLGTRWGFWHYRLGLGMLGAGAVAGAIGAIVSLAGGILSGTRRAAFRMAAAGIVAGLIATGIPWSWSRTATQVPKIHDVTTDTADPPRFVALLPLRDGAENPPAYDGPETAEKQNLAYPDIQTLTLPLPPGAAFNRAVTAARDMGWELVSMNSLEGRIEATATTFWFGFKDDVVVRVKAAKDGSRIDVRSLSRVGAGDVGTNAKRIRTFLQKMRDTDTGGAQESRSAQ